MSYFLQTHLFTRFLVGIGAWSHRSIPSIPFRSQDLCWVTLRVQEIQLVYAENAWTLPRGKIPPRNEFD